MALEVADIQILIDVTEMELTRMETVNADAVKRGWTGTGVYGYSIKRYKEIISKLQILKGK